jgi:hypothetical protein
MKLLMPFGRIVLALAVAVLLSLELGLWTEAELHHGPFLKAQGAMVYVPVGAKHLNLVRSDSNDHPRQSTLRLWVNGSEYGGPHSVHAQIAKGEPGLFSHWGTNVFLALPQGTANDKGTTIRLSYPLQLPSRPLSLALIYVFLTCLILSFGRNLHPRIILAGLRKQRRLAAIAILIGTGGIVALEAGVLTREVAVHGPFASETPGSSMLVVPVVAHASLLDKLLTARSDTNEAPLRSRLTLFVDGQKYSPHALHDVIRSGQSGLFSHWDGAVRFALPKGLVNNSAVEVRLIYPLQLASGWLTLAVIAALLTLWLAIEVPWLTKDRVALLLSIPAGCLFLLLLVAGLGTAVYAFATAYGGIAGWALPTTIFRVIPGGTLVASAEPYFMEVVLFVAAFGILAHWGAYQSEALTPKVAAAEARTAQAAGLFGLPIAFGLVILSVSAQWAGMWRPGDFTGAAVAGLVPFSDANSYFGQAHDVLRDGVFGVLGARRPIAEAFRSTLLAFGGYSYSNMIILQSLLFSAVTFIASVSIARWRGLWAGIAFFAMIFVIGREFISTSLTESLGLIWAIAAVPFFAESLRSRSFWPGIIALLIFAVAMFTRMGSMFTIPAIWLWLVSQFGSTFRRKFVILIICGGATIGVALVNFGVAKLYTRDLGMVGSNFSYVLCGRTIGGLWSDCLTRYKKEIPPEVRNNENRLVKLMYTKAYENFINRPSVLFVSLEEGALEFASAVPSILTQGYLPIPLRLSDSGRLFQIVVLFGLGMALLRMRRHELLFWLLFWASALLSAGFIYFDDGRRAMIAIYPMAALFFASGLKNKHAHPATAPRPALVGTRTALTVAAFGLVGLIAPAFAHVFLRPSAYLPSTAAGTPNERFVFGGQRVTGVYVEADGAPLRSDVPSMHLSDFTDIVHQSGLEQYQDLVTPQAPPTPFGFIESPNLVEGTPTGQLYIVPPEVLLKKNIPAWHFVVENWGNEKGFGRYWFRVAKAEPLQKDDRH